MDATGIRARLCANGYSPIPLRGKVPVLLKWQEHTSTNSEEIVLWRTMYPDAGNTGILTARHPTIDADLSIVEAAEAIEELARDWFGERGPILTRIGKWPKRAIVLRTDIPFGKLVRNVTAPSSKQEKIEVLCDGQQVVVHGIHPDTHKPYLWHGGELEQVGADELPYASCEDMEAFLDAAVALLVRAHSYTAAPERPKAPPKANGSHTSGAGTDDWSYLLGNVMAGRELHDSLRDLAAKYAKAGMSAATITNLLRAHMELSTARDDRARSRDWGDRYNDIPRAAEGAVVKFGAVAPLKGGTGLTCVEAFPIDGPKLPTRFWKVPGLLMASHVSLVVAPPGIGKSLLTLQITLMCASGKPWAKWTPRGKYRTLLINIEEDETEMRRRLHGARCIMGLDEKDLGGILLAKANEIVVARVDGRTKTVTATPMFDEIVAAIKQHQIDIVVVDPFAETFSGDENSNSELKWVAVLWREVARLTGCAVLLVHHAKKYSSNMAGDMDAARGGGSLAGVARIISTLFTMSAEDYEVYEDAIKKQFPAQSDKGRFVRFDDAKATFSLMSPTASWFRKVSVGLGNGHDGIPEDEVGVLVPWMPPDPFEDMDCATANRILDEIAVGVRADSGKPTGDPYSLSNKAGTKRWVGVLLQRELTCSPADAKKIAEKWFENGVLVEYLAPTSTSKGNNSKCLRVVDAMRPGRIISEAKL